MAGVEHAITVEPDEAGMRLDRWFKIHFPGLGFGPWLALNISAEAAALRPGPRRWRPRQIRCARAARPGGARSADGGRCQEERQARSPATICATHPRCELLSRMVLHEDDKVIVLNKPAGLAVQGGSGVTAISTTCSKPGPARRARSRGWCTGSTATHPACWSIARTRGAARS
jgi:23S rRNA pseudouridine955/2504/2580 synthase